jgi:hypothetical protein
MELSKQINGINNFVMRTGTAEFGTICGMLKIA